MHETLKELLSNDSCNFVRLSSLLGDSVQKEYISMLKVKKYTEIKKERKLMFKRAKDGSQDIDYSILNKNAFTVVYNLYFVSIQNYHMNI